ncbi:cation:proton antiporter regulatory subunit [Nocardia pseudovaccinii]|uniref:cation:proton antiporter regulatory subunit n=1 Tax=Nocardia pseudovaccinii TaxID=189540 RepID=UPI003D9212DD
MHIEGAFLPGIGVHKDISLTSSRRIGVVDRRDGTVDLIVGKPGDPDVAGRILLSASEAALLAALLGAPQLVARPQDDCRDIHAVAIRHVPIHRGSTYDGQRLSQTRMRARAKASIVAVIRAGQVIPSPGPDLVFTTGDVLVIVGTADGVTTAVRILTHG